MRPRLPDARGEVIARDGVRDAVPVHDETAVLYGLCVCVTICFVQGCIYDEQYTIRRSGPRGSRQVQKRGVAVGSRWIDSEKAGITAGL